MNAFSDTLNTLTTKIMFVSQSNPGGGGSPVPQTGDVIGMIFAIIAAITLISIFAIFIGTKKSSTVQANGSLAKTKSIGIVLGIVAAISLLGILFCYTPLGNAFAQEQVESAATINAYVNEETGEITFDENYIKNNTTKDIVVEASDMEMTEDMATISGIENLEFTITGMDSVLFKGTLAQPGEERTPQDPYDNLNNTVGSGQTTAVTYTLENYDKNLALSLIGKEVCFTTLNSVNAVKFSYGVGEGAEGEAPKIQVLTNKHNTIEIQPLDTEEIVK